MCSPAGVNFDARLARFAEERAVERERYEKEAQEHSRVKERALQLQVSRQYLPCQSRQVMPPAQMQQGARLED